MNTVIQLRPSRSEKPTVRGGRAKNADYRQREYLTESEIDKLVAAAGDSRNPVRDRLLILMAFRHALRVSELVDLRWQQITALLRAIVYPACVKQRTGIRSEEMSESIPGRAEEPPEALRHRWRGGHFCAASIAHQLTCSPNWFGSLSRLAIELNFLKPVGAGGNLGSAREYAKLKML